MFYGVELCSVTLELQQVWLAIQSIGKFARDK